MAQRKFTLALGAPIGDMAESAGTPIAGGNAIEVNIDFDPAVMTRGALLRHLKKFERRILAGNWPPA